MSPKTQCVAGSLYGDGRLRLLYPSVDHFRVPFISLRHQLLLGVSVRSASLKADQVIHRVSMSVSHQASRLSFRREATEGSA